MPTPFLYDKECLISDIPQRTLFAFQSVPAQNPQHQNIRWQLHGSYHTWSYTVLSTASNHSLEVSPPGTSTAR